MKHQWSKWFFGAAALLLAGAVAFVLHNVWEANRAGQAAQQAGSALMQQIAQRTEHTAMPLAAEDTETSETVNPATPVPTASLSPAPEDTLAARAENTFPAMTATNAPQKTVSPSPTAAVSATKTATPDIPAPSDALRETMPPPMETDTPTDAGGLVRVGIVPPVSTRMPDFPAEMATVEVEGEEYIGLLEIPALALSLPVMADWSYPQLKIAPCRFSGTQLEHNLIVIGHNYDQHFGRLNQLTPGDQITFTNVDGQRTAYVVRKTDILSPMAIDKLTASGYDLALVTCTVGGATRVAVYCEQGD